MSFECALQSNIKQCLAIIKKEDNEFLKKYESTFNINRHFLIWYNVIERSNSFLIIKNPTVKNNT